MTTMALLLFAAALGFGGARVFGLPAAPLLIVAGFLVSRAIELPGELVQDALVLGVTVMVFVAGIELNPQRVGSQGKAAIQVGLLQFVVLGTLGGVAAIVLGFEAETAAYLALAFTASSTLVAVRILKNRGQLFDPMGRMVTGVLLLQDLLVILLIPVLTRLPDGPGAIAMGVVSTLGLVVLSGIMMLWVAPPVVSRLAKDEEGLLLFIFGTLFVFTGLSWLLGLPLISGSFLAGVALSPFPVGALIRSQLNSLSDFFTAIFFTGLGAILVLPSGIMFGYAVALAVAVIVLTPPIVAYLAERAGFSARPAIQGGLLLAQTSEFSLVIALQGVVLSQISPELFGLIVMVTILTMVATPFLTGDAVTQFLVRLHPWQRRALAGDPPSGHILLVGCGANGTTLLEFLMTSSQPFFVLDDDPAVVARLEEAGIPVARGDASDPSALDRAGVGEARLVISTIRRVYDNRRLLEKRDGRPTIVRTFEPGESEWVEARGGRPADYSLAAADGFLQWYEEASLMDSPPEST
jgi:Kef-type K+ transport system membrane component KefB